MLIFVAAETGVSVQLPSKLTCASAAIPAFRPCLPSRCLAMDCSVSQYEWGSSARIDLYSEK
jgi:hypothetical protein